MYINKMFHQILFFWVKDKKWKILIFTKLLKKKTMIFVRSLLMQMGILIRIELVGSWC